jgi:hypothetical protein
MERVALNLDGPALSVFGQDATAGWAFPTGGSIPSSLAGYHVIRSLNEGVQGFFWLGGAAGGEGQTKNIRSHPSKQDVHRLRKEKSSIKLVGGLSSRTGRQ